MFNTDMRIPCSARFPVHGNPGPRFWLAWIVLLGLLAAPAPLRAQTGPDSTLKVPVLRVTVTNGVVTRQHPGYPMETCSSNTFIYPGDVVSTGPRSHAVLQVVNADFTISMGEDSKVRVAEPDRTGTVMRVLKGVFYFFHRDEPDRFRIEAPTGYAIFRGTEVTVEVAEDGTTQYAVLEGAAEIHTAGQQVALGGREEVVVPAGGQLLPQKRSLTNGVGHIQWCLYYPPVLRAADLELEAGQQELLRASLDAYQAGDPAGALAAYPVGRTPATPAEKVYLGALLIARGQVGEARRWLADAGNAAERTARLRAALQALMAAVQFEGRTPPPAIGAAERLPTEWLVASYQHQSNGRLAPALAAAWRAVLGAPEWGLAWARVAELEFGSGHTERARTAVEHSLNLAPASAEAVCLQGFLLAARDRISEAVRAFERAMQMDGGLGTAWLGRGLCAIRQGRATAGRADLLMAATLEPNRSLPRSYLGKAWAEAGDSVRAERELQLAKELDPKDPTPWLYAALLHHDEYRPVDAIRELQESQLLNTNRQIYRSGFLLDQDQAVRSANLGNIYADAGMTATSLAEAARATAFDYGNYSAHLNLASTFNELRDPTRFNLRYETEWFNEQLLANLLAPVGASSLSQNLSQQEYSRLFAVDRVGISGTTEYFSSGEVRQTASQFGTFGTTSYALDLDYQYKEGIRTNNDLARTEWYSRIKQQVTPEDSFLLLTKYEDYSAGDNFQYYNAADARGGYRFNETQTPLLLAGWHHEWGPGAHTLFLGGRLENQQQFSDLGATQLVALAPFGNPVGIPFAIDYANQFQIYTAEINQIFQQAHHTEIFGARFQDGTFRATANLDNPPPADAPFFALPVNSSTDARFRRMSAYGYHHWEVVDGLILMGGVAYDREEYPWNYRRPPLGTGTAEKHRVLPKAAFVWNLNPNLTLRGVFSRSLGGVSYDESVRLEPTQLAGFDQSYRSLISESLVGSVEAPDYRTAGGAMDVKLRSSTWLTLQGESVRQQVGEGFGYFDDTFLGMPAIVPVAGTEIFDYNELTLKATASQLLGREWLLQAQYQYTRSELTTTLPDVPAPAGYARTTVATAALEELRLGLAWQHPSGFFARGELWWFRQQLGGSTPQPPGDSFPELNLFAGYRFPKRRAELTLGILNANGTDYALSPLNYYQELPHSRLFYTRFRFSF